MLSENSIEDVVTFTSAEAMYSSEKPRKLMNNQWLSNARNCKENAPGVHISPLAQYDVDAANVDAEDINEQALCSGPDANFPAEIVNQKAREEKGNKEIAVQIKGPGSGPAHDPFRIAKYVSAANFPLTRLIYPTISTFTPYFATVFYYLNYMDFLMTSTECWTDDCVGWVLPLLTNLHRRAALHSDYASYGCSW